MKRQSNINSIISHRASSCTCWDNGGCIKRRKRFSPPPDGGYPGGNTAEGTSALLAHDRGGTSMLPPVGFSLESTAPATQYGHGAERCPQYC